MVIKYIKDYKDKKAGTIAVVSTNVAYTLIDELRVAKIWSPATRAMRPAKPRRRYKTRKY